MNCILEIVFYDQHWFIFIGKLIVQF